MKKLSLIVIITMAGLGACVSVHANMAKHNLTNTYKSV
jgi:hypothetical protein